MAATEAEGSTATSAEPIPGFRFLTPDGSESAYPVAAFNPRELRAAGSSSGELVCELLEALRLFAGQRGWDSRLAEDASIAWSPRSP